MPYIGYISNFNKRFCTYGAGTIEKVNKLAIKVFSFVIFGIKVNNAHDFIALYICP